MIQIGDKICKYSPEDRELIMQHQWRPKNHKSQRCRKDRWVLISRGTREYMHRIIAGAKPGEVVDHINRDPLDNRRCNLRICTIQQNTWNSVHPKRSPNASKYKGIYYNKSQRGTKKWRAQIMVNGKKLNLGNYDNEEDAARAYDTAARNYFGEYARTNFELRERRL